MYVYQRVIAITRYLTNYFNSYYSGFNLSIIVDLPINKLQHYSGAIIVDLPISWIYLLITIFSIVLCMFARGYVSYGYWCIRKMPESNVAQAGCRIPRVAGRRLAAPHAEKWESSMAQRQNLRPGCR